MARRLGPRVRTRTITVHRHRRAGPAGRQKAEQAVEINGLTNVKHPPAADGRGEALLVRRGDEDRNRRGVPLPEAVDQFHAVHAREVEIDQCHARGGARFERPQRVLAGRGRIGRVAARLEQLREDPPGDPVVLHDEYRRGVVRGRRGSARPAAIATPTVGWRRAIPSTGPPRERRALRPMRSAMPRQQFQKLALREPSYRGFRKERAA